MLNTERFMLMLRKMLFATAIAVGLTTAASAAIVEMRATLSGGAEVPATTSPGYGDVLARLDTTAKTLAYTVTFYNLTGPLTGAHFHGPAGLGNNAAVVHPIARDGQTPLTGSVTLTDAQMAELQRGQWYVNVHTAANPNGEIRGQMMGSEGARMGGMGSERGRMGGMHERMQERMHGDHPAGERPSTMPMRR